MAPRIRLQVKGMFNGQGNWNFPSSQGSTNNNNNNNNNASGNMNQFNNISGGINNGISNNRLNPTNVNGGNNNNINSNGSSGNNVNGNNNGQMGGNGVNLAMAFGNANTGMSSNPNMNINNSGGNVSMPKQVKPQQLLQWLMNLDPQRRNAVVQKNAQIGHFLEQYEQHRKAAMQQMMANQKIAAGHMNSPQMQNQSPVAMNNGSPNPAMSHPYTNATEGQMMQQQIPNGPVSQGPQNGSPLAQGAHVQPQMYHQGSKFMNPNIPATSPMVPPGMISSSSRPHVVNSPGALLQNVPVAPPSGQNASPRPFAGVGNPEVAVSSEKTPEQIPHQQALPPSRKMPSLHYWSDFFTKKMHDVPSTVKTYERITSRDAEYDTGMQNERARPFDADMAERMARDLKFYQKIRDSRLKAINLRPEQNKVTDRLWGEGYAGYGNGFTTGRTELILPANRKKATTAPDIYISKEQLEEQAETPEELVPIRLEFDQDRDGFQLSDTFLWNMNEKVISLGEFVDTLMADYLFPNDKLADSKKKIIDSIRDQLGDYHPMIYPENGSDNPLQADDHTKKSKQCDLRFPIMLDITIGNNQLTDKFDWDVMNPNNDPEDFARVLCAEMSLPGEFQTAISHSIREQCQTYIKSLYLVGYRFDGSPVSGEELKEFVSSNLDAHNVIRPRYLLSDYTASLQELSFESIQKLKKEREREARRKKRGQTRVGRRGGVLLPDLRDLPKTFRTPVPTSVLAGGVSLGSGPDAYIDYPISIEIPQRQLKALDDYKREQLKIKEEEKKKQLEMEKHRQDDQARVARFLAKTKRRLASITDRPTIRVSCECNPEEVLIKFKIT